MFFFVGCSTARPTREGTKDQNPKKHKQQKHSNTSKPLRNSAHPRSRDAQFLVYAQMIEPVWESNRCNGG